MYNNENAWCLQKRYILCEIKCAIFLCSQPCFKYLTIQRKQYVDIFHFHRQLKTSQISEQLSVIISKGQGLGSLTEVKVKASFLNIWKLSGNQSTWRCLFQTVKTLYWMSCQQGRDHAVTGDRRITCVQIFRALARCIPNTSNFLPFFQTHGNLSSNPGRPFS